MNSFSSMLTSFNWIDYVVLVIFLLSILSGFARGFAKEIFALITWIAAIVVAALFATRLAAVFSSNPQVQATLSSVNSAQPVSTTAIVVSFLLIFFAIIILGKIIGFFIPSPFGASPINRLFGGIFGFARGFVIVLFIMFLVQLSPLAESPYWKGSQLVNAFQPAIKWLDDTIQPGVQKVQTIKTKVIKKTEEIGNQYFQDI